MKTLILIIVFLFAVYFSACSSGGSNTDKAEIAGTEWLLESMNGKTVTPPDGKNVTLILDAVTGKLSGKSTCNSYFGSYKLDGSLISFSEIGSTNMMCDEMQVEIDYISTLKTVEMYSLKSGKLNLSSSSAVVLEFKKK